MKRFFHSYLTHIRKQPERAKRIHAFSIAGVITVILATLWLHFHYGLWSFGSVEVYSADQSYEVRNLSSEASSTEILEDPSNVFSNFFEEIKRRVSNVPTNFSNAISDTKTFERGE
jgi:hypothetical protein